MATPARMSDVAKLAHVSVMSVSRVLNGNVHVSDATRERVLAAVGALRYQPNELARSLREQRSRQIGIIVPYLSDPFFAHCAHAISTVVKEHAYSVVLSTSNEDAESEFAEASRMMRRNVEGLIVIPAKLRAGGSKLNGPEFDRMPIVTLDRPVDGSAFDSILVDNVEGAEVGTKHLIDLKHKRIAYIGLTDALYTMKMRHRGYSRAMKAAGLAPQSLLLPGDLMASLTQVKALVTGPKPPTALFCANNLVTRHVLHALHAVGMYPPEGVALVGFDDFETADLMRPGITVVCQASEVLGRTAAEMLFARLSGDTSPAKLEVIPTELVVRGSCGTMTHA